MRLSASQKLAASAGSAVIVLVFGALAYRGTRQVHESAALVAHTHEVIERLDHVLLGLVDAETGQRGYAISGEERYLEPYLGTGVAAAADLAALRTLTADNSAQQRRLDSLAVLVAREQEILGRQIRVRRDSGFARARAALTAGSGKAVMDEVRRVSGEMSAAERELLAERQRIERVDRTRVLWVIALGTVMAIIVAVLLNRALTRYADEQGRSAQELAAGNQQMQEQAFELESQAAELEEAATELEASNEELQEAGAQLAERTRAAEAALAEAEAANQTKSDFLAAMSHELRTPLNVIGGYVELMEMGLRGQVSEMQLEDLRRIKKSQRALLSFVNDILNFARLDAGHVEFNIADLSLASILDAVETMIEPQVRARGLTYADASNAPYIVRVDPEKTEQVLLNLLTNAIKFTPQGGTITVSCGEHDSMVWVRVQDTGRGIPASKLSAIFDPFVQVDRHLTAESQQGVGLGLAISRDLARGMGGDITVESTPGAGSTFTFTVPRAATAADA